MFYVRFPLVVICKVGGRDSTGQCIQVHLYDHIFVDIGNSSSTSNPLDTKHQAGSYVYWTQTDTGASGSHGHDSTGHSCNMDIY